MLAFGGVNLTVRDLRVGVNEVSTFKALVFVFFQGQNVSFRKGISSVIFAVSA